MAGRVKHAQRSHRSYAVQAAQFDGFARRSAVYASTRAAKKTTGILESLKNMLHKSQAK